MKIEQNLYDRAKMDAKQVAEITTQLAFLTSLEEQNVVNGEKISADYETRRLRDIKNLISNIYLLLDLHEVKGIADIIYNADYKPLD